MEVITREIMWNIPSWMKSCMYISFAFSLIILAWGFYRQCGLVALGQGTGWRELFPSKLNFGGFFKSLLLQGKVAPK